MPFEDWPLRSGLRRTSEQMKAGAECRTIAVGEVRRDDLFDSGVIRPAIDGQHRPSRPFHPDDVDVFEPSGEYLIGQL